MKPISLLPALLFFVIVAIGCAVAYALYGGIGDGVASIAVVGIAILAAAVVANAVKVAAPWDRAVVLRLGRSIPSTPQLDLGSELDAPSRSNKTRRRWSAVITIAAPIGSASSHTGDTGAIENSASTPGT